MLQNIFRLIRLPNLFIIALSMVLMQYTLIIPVTSVNPFTIFIDPVVFALITLSTVLVAAGGYAINDILDVKIDLINKPEKVLVGKRIPLATCWNLYWTFTAAGVAIGIAAAGLNKTNVLMSVAPLEAALLWFYSSILKKYFLIGNLVVSFLCALALFKPMLFNAETVKVEGLSYLVLGYTAFAFLITLIREIIKDIEDHKGDEVYDCKTMPIVIGIRATKIFNALLILIVIISLGSFQYNQTLSETFKQTDYLSFSYISLFIQLPLAILIMILFRAKESTDFHRASNIAKLIMVSGILSMLVFYMLF